jgi:hypothetical protein
MHNKFNLKMFDSSSDGEDSDLEMKVLELDIDLKKGSIID